MEQNKILRSEIDNDESMIDLMELFKVLLSKAFVIILTGIVTAVIVFACTKILITPIYTSTTKVYVLTKQNNESNITYSDLQMSSQFTKDYMELVKSRPVLENTIEVLGLNMSTSELSDMIFVEAPDTDTRIFSISVKSPDPTEAKKIVDVVREEAGRQITEIMAVDAVNTVEDGNLPTTPSSPNVLKNIILGMILGMLLAIGVITMRYLMDDTIKTPDDVEKYLGISVLTSIPISEGQKKGKKCIRVK